ncbi:helix-turn-helix domain-containing protein [Mycobacterium sp. MYCO198283]|uniref:helix-turn-helix transcriptional regulator n=1 Tax=Mycobacterium sp. MYCO198283 TaxID=2883505 RepID=UPI001E32672B|nr:helix-turn-helix domain-containing protein [Mycobacterium sp. MYCO198283]MCG5431483.1 helix-turn-helix domain-containing protein [Mycobacterium sp. MYCO198283]
MGKQLTDYPPGVLIPARDMPSLEDFKDTMAQTWNVLRHKGTGPRYVKLGGRVYYRRADIEAWIEANVYTRPDHPVA